MKKPLFLILKRHWYNKIASGEKTIEYRTFNEFWFTRLAGKDYSEVLFQLGYSKSAPRMIMPIIKIEISIDPDTLADCFLIHLDIAHLKHLVPTPK